MCYASSPSRDVEDAMSEEFVEDEEQRRYELRFENTELYRCKWLLDGCKTIQEMADRLRSEAERLDRLQNDGWRLEDEVLDDYGHLVPANIDELIDRGLREQRE